jgi:hypothetical protein
MSESTNPGDRTPLPEGVFCPDCGYDLRGSTSERCSECGFVLDELRRAESQIPWTYRRKLGRFRAYWKTVWLVLRQPRRFCMEAVRPVSYRDSQSFRWLTVLHAYAPILVGSLVVGVVGQEKGWWASDIPWWVVTGVQARTLLMLVLVPGLTSYFFQARRLSVEQQNRAIALSYYVSAPLSLVPLLLPFYGLALLALSDAPPADAPRTLGAAGALLGLLVIVLYERTVYRFVRALMRVSVLAALLRMLLLNLSGLVLLALIMLLILTPIYALIMWYSFH